MDSRFINPVLKAVTNTFSSMAGINPEPGKPRIRQWNEPVDGAVSGIMTISSESAEASVALSFSKGTMLRVASHMFNEEKTSIDCMVFDLVGELTNIIMGLSKAEFCTDYQDVNMSLPVVIVGEGHLISHRVDAPIICQRAWALLG